MIAPYTLKREGQVLTIHAEYSDEELERLRFDKDQLFKSVSERFSRELAHAILNDKSFEVEVRHDEMRGRTRYSSRLYVFTEQQLNELAMELNGP